MGLLAKTYQVLHDIFPDAILKAESTAVDSSWDWQTTTTEIKDPNSVELQLGHHTITARYLTSDTEWCPVTLAWVQKIKIPTAKGRVIAGQRTRDSMEVTDENDVVGWASYARQVMIDEALTIAAPMLHPDSFLPHELQARGDLLTALWTLRVCGISEHQAAILILDAQTNPWPWKESSKPNTWGCIFGSVNIAVRECSKIVGATELTYQIGYKVPISAHNLLVKGITLESKGLLPMDTTDPTKAATVSFLGTVLHELYEWTQRTALCAIPESPKP